MKIVLIVFAIAAAIIALMVLVPVFLTIEYEYKNGGLWIKLQYLFVKIKLYPKKEKPKNKRKSLKKDAEQNSGNDKNKVKSKKSSMQVMDVIQKIPQIWEQITEVLYILAKKAIYIKELDIRSDFGFNDPMMTGIAVGAFNGLVYNTVSVIYRCTNLLKWNVELKPDFEKEQLHIKMKSIIKIKIVYIIVILVKLVKIFFKINK